MDFEKIKNLPPTVKYAAGGFLAVFGLALVVGLSSGPGGSTPTQPALVAPTGAQVNAQSAPAAVSAPSAVTPAVATGATLATPAAVPPVQQKMGRQAKKLDQSFIDRLAPSSARTSFTVAMSKNGEENELGSIVEKDVSMNISVVPSAFPKAQQKIVLNQPVQKISRRGYIKAEVDGDYALTVYTKSNNDKHACAIFIDDTTTPALVTKDLVSTQGSAFVTEASALTSVNLMAGYHLVVTTCETLSEGGYITGGRRSHSSEFSIRVPGGTAMAIDPMWAEEQK